MLYISGVFVGFFISDVDSRCCKSYVEESEKKMPSKIVSFGFRHYGGSPPGTGGTDTLVIDIRKVFDRNPYHDKKLRKLRGDHIDVQRDIQKTSGFFVGLQNLKEKVALCEGPVYLGCTGGHHRSVYLAILMSEYFKVPVEHLDYDKP